MTQNTFLDKPSDSKEARAQITRESLRKTLKPKYEGLNKPPSDYLTQVAIGKKMKEWVFEKLAAKELITIDDFPLSENMNPWRFKKIADDNPEFAEMLQAANYAIGSGMLKA